MEGKGAKTTQQRPPAYAQVLVSSTDRYTNFTDIYYSPTTSASWRLNKQIAVMYGYFHRLAITELQVQWNIPTIVAGKNDLFILTLTAAPDVTSAITIPQGFYTGAELAAVIQSLLVADDAAWTAAGLSVQFVGGKFVFSVDTGELINIESIEPLPWAQANVADNTSQLRCLTTLGLLDNNLSDPAETLTGAPAPLLYTRWMDICSSYLTKYQKAKDTTTLPGDLVSNVLHRVYAVPPNTSTSVSSTSFTTGTQTTPGEAPVVQTIDTASVGVTSTLARPWIMCIDPNTPKHIRWSTEEAVANFDIQVVDEYGEPIFWSQQFPTEYQFTLFASET
jgi:hypothetical protein